MPETTAKKKCFVVMGFGTKTDFQQQKSYDLDKTYRIIIKKAVEEAGLECIRADDIIHAGIIDKPMYELLLGADVVVADLSTTNANAIYELGVRHALRPHTTIVIAEKNFKFPFDIGHLLVRPYTHLGEGIDAEDAEAAREVLKKAIQELAEKENKEPDSPVYTFLPTLRQPSLEEVKEMQSMVAAAAPSAGDQTVGLLMKMFREARRKENWAGATMALEQLKTNMPGDPFILQQLALATYKSKLPDPKSALAEARKILQELQPETTNDPETLGIWGAIHKRLWELDSKPEDLDESIRSYGKGFYLKDDHYNGINYAYMLNVRASVTARPGRDRGLCLGGAGAPSRYRVERSAARDRRQGRRRQHRSRANVLAAGHPDRSSGRHRRCGPRRFGKDCSHPGGPRKVDGRLAGRTAGKARQDARECASLNLADSVSISLDAAFRRNVSAITGTACPVSGVRRSAKWTNAQADTQDLKTSAHP